MPERIQRKRTKGWTTPLCSCGCGQRAIYVGRPTKWGNPFQLDGPDSIGLDISLTLYRNAIQGIWDTSPLHHLGDKLYTRLYTAHKHWRARLGPGHPLETTRAELRGHDLVCWCPLVNSHGENVPCHADVLLSIANDIPIDEVVRENTRRATGKALR